MSPDRSTEARPPVPDALVTGVTPFATVGDGTDGFEATTPSAGTPTPERAHSHSDWPVITAGCSIPTSFRSVGATSASASGARVEDDSDHVSSAGGACIRTLTGAELVTVEVLARAV